VADGESNDSMVSADENQKGFSDLVSVADGESDDNEVSANVLSVSSGKNSLLDSLGLGFCLFISYVS
jgi:hypothetical protein